MFPEDNQPEETPVTPDETPNTFAPLDEMDTQPDGSPQFDSRKVYGRVRGHHMQAAFLQDGHYFDAQGEYLDSMPAPKAIQTGRMRPVRAAPPPAPTLPPHPEPLATDEWLAEWAAGRQQEQWPKVQVAVENATGTRPKSKAEAVKLLADHGVTHGDDLDDTHG